MGAGVISYTLSVTAKFDPHFRKADPILTQSDLEKQVSQAMAEQAAALTVNGTRGAAKRACMLKTISDALDSTIERMPISMTAREWVMEIDLEQSAETATVVLRERTTLDAMKEAACGK